jgi:hypothetical protein
MVVLLWIFRDITAKKSELAAVLWFAGLQPREIAWSRINTHRLPQGREHI